MPISLIEIEIVSSGVWPSLISNAYIIQGCVFTRDINKAMLISDAMETGTVQINSAPARGPDHFPFQACSLSMMQIKENNFFIAWKCLRLYLDQGFDEGKKNRNGKVRRSNN